MTTDRQPFDYHDDRMELRVELIDYCRADDTGRPVTVEAIHVFQPHELARTSTDGIVKHAVEITARSVAREYRSGVEYRQHQRDTTHYDSPFDHDD